YSFLFGLYRRDEPNNLFLCLMFALTRVSRGNYIFDMLHFYNHHYSLMSRLDDNMYAHRMFSWTRFYLKWGRNITEDIIENDLYDCIIPDHPFKPGTNKAVAVLHSFIVKMHRKQLKIFLCLSVGLLNQPVLMLGLGAAYPDLDFCRGFKNGGTSQRTDPTALSTIILDAYLQSDCNMFAVATCKDFRPALFFLTFMIHRLLSETNMGIWFRRLKVLNIAQEIAQWFSAPLLLMAISCNLEGWKSPIFLKPNAQWDLSAARIFNEICVEQVLANNRPQGCLNNKGASGYATLALFLLYEMVICCRYAYRDRKKTLASYMYSLLLFVHYCYLFITTIYSLLLFIHVVWLSYFIHVQK
ncbi:hypothetical protein ACJX0J_024059, partial [Zea mays]